MTEEAVEKTNTGVKSTGESINWKYLKEERVNDPIISELIKEATEIYMIDGSSSIKQNNFALSVYINSFNEYLVKKKYKFTFNLDTSVSTKSADINTKTDKKQKEKKLSKKEIILQTRKEENTKKEISDFFDNLVITNHMPLISRQPIVAFFCILNWNIYLISNKKKEIGLDIYFNAAISLFRAIKDCTSILSPELVIQFNDVLIEIETIISNKKNGVESFNFMKANIKTIADSFWDKNKPRAITLYDEQKYIIELVTSNLDKKLCIFFEMPPANGKTILSAILAKVIAHKNKDYIEKDPFYKRKTLLYICYNTIVRNEVAKLCITQNIDLKYWLAITQVDKEDAIQKTFLRPYKSCYPDWNQKNLRTKKEEAEFHKLRKKRFSSDIYEQWEFSLHETRPIKEQKFNITDYENAPNMPEMIIADLESAYSLLKAFPNTFISYFDEAFASADLEITAKIMSVLGHTVLVSATLAKPTEIPTVLTDFKLRHGHQTDDFLHIVKSNVQHISCTFINSIGNIYSPHDYVENFSTLNDFIDIIDEPIVKRGYSPEIVFNMVILIDSLLEEDLKFSNRFPHYGILSHESIREYGCDILRYIFNNGREDIFQVLKSKKIRKIPNMDINTLFTTSAFKFQSGKTLHVSTMSDFNNHVNRIAEPFLDGSPKISDVISLYSKTKKQIEFEISNLIKNSTKDSNSEEDIAQFQKELNELTLVWPAEYILNSHAHASKFGTLQYLVTPNNNVFGKVGDIEILDDIRAKLFMSSIGIYQPSVFNDENMDQFLRNKDGFKFILSTPEIVYGTNIDLSIIDINSSFIADSTRNTLYQLIGRAGRKGKSHSATIIIRDDEMLNLIFGKIIKNIEAENIENNYAKILERRP
jgi:hypothetical protein